MQSASVRANGVPALAIELADRDGDSAAEWHAVFDRSAILATLPPAGRVEVTLSGTLGETALHATAGLEIVPVQPPDADGDGIEDSVDACLASEPGATVDTRGCSIAQYCDCGSATRHGRHQRCVARVSRQFVKAGLIERSERRQLLRAAARADCGQDRHHAHSHDAEDRDRADEDDQYTHEHERKRRRDEHSGDDDDREHARGKHARGWLNAPGGADR